MNRGPDPLVSSSHADRLHYSTGELLGADDFRAEQTYHRRQLARALLHLHGSGTIAGLEVTATHQPGSGATPDEVEIRVGAGLALDHAGRLIEVSRDACLRLRRWYTFVAGRPPGTTELNVSALVTARHDDARFAAGGAVVADVFLAFHECPRGYTPAFATGPFDALDASQPSRVRDAYELTLVPRPETSLPSASDPWAVISAETGLAARISKAKQIASDLWKQGVQPAPENPAGVDPTAVLLARLRIPAAVNPDASQAPDADWSDTAWPDDGPNVENGVRHVLLPPTAIFRLFAT